MIIANVNKTIESDTSGTNSIAQANSDIYLGLEDKEIIFSGSVYYWNLIHLVLLILLILYTGGKTVKEEDT